MNNTNNNSSPTKGDRRTHFCKEANETTEQEYTGDNWLCLHDGTPPTKQNNNIKQAILTEAKKDINKYCRILLNNLTKDPDLANKAADKIDEIKYNTDTKLSLLNQVT